MRDPGWTYWDATCPRLVVFSHFDVDLHSERSDLTPLLLLFQIIMSGCLIMQMTLLR